MMSFTCLLSAQTVPAILLASSWQNLSRSTSDLGLVLAAVAALTVLFLIWAAFFRKRHKPVSGWHMHYSGGRRPAGSGDDAQGRRRRRRRRRDHRPRNPTLAETGGLPPARAEEPPETAL